MLAAKPAGEADGEILRRLTKAGRALLEAASTATIRIANQEYYALPTLTLLEFAAAVREAEATVKENEENSHE